MRVLSLIRSWKDFHGLPHAGLPHACVGHSVAIVSVEPERLLVAAAQLVPQRSESCRTTHCPVRGLQPLLQGVAAPRESQSHSTET